MLRRLGIAFSLSWFVACGSLTEPPDPGEEPPGTISGTERLGWTQTAADAAELATFQYAIYVDDARSELTGVSCNPSGSAFSCTAQLPSMSSGAHKLELATFVLWEGTVIESGKSPALQVNVAARFASPAQPLDAWPRETLVLADGVRVRLEQMAGEVSQPTDAAFAPDSRIFVAEHEGRIRIVRDGQVQSAPALSLKDSGAAGAHLLALAVDPAFTRTHHVYAIYTTPSASGARTFTLARFREAAGTLADQIVLLDRIPSSSSTEGASLRFGADGKLFVALDDGGIPSVGGDLSAPNGKILRLNPDGSTPTDQAGGTPLFSYPYRSPHGADWFGPANVLWMADRDSPSSGRLVAVTAGADSMNVRGVVRAVFPLPRGTVPSSIAFARTTSIAGLRENLLVASDEGRHLYRVQFDPGNPMRVTATERLLQDQIGGIHLVATAPDGMIYLGTSNAFGRLVAGE